MSSLLAKVNRGITPKQKNVVTTEIKFGLPFMVPDFVYIYIINDLLKGNLSY
jgi:hypothetical protein